MKIYDTLDLITPPANTVLGNHGIWVPSICVKVPFQFAGECRKRTKSTDPGYPRDTIANEYMMMRALAAQGMAPPVGDLVFFREVVSDFPGAWHCDPCGAYGYEVADARKLPPGRFSLDAMKRMPIEGSDAAWGDVSKPENVINGYLVDVRRSGFDLLRWNGNQANLPDARESVDELRGCVHRECQFPPGERAEAYQDFWLRGELITGQRRVVERARAMGFDPRPADTVLDIGCQSGGFLQYAWQQAGGIGKFVGVEVNDQYTSCARALARSCGQNVNIRKLDAVKDRDALLKWVRAYFGSPPAHMMLLSMEKHLGESSMFALVDAIGAKRTYIETNAVAEDTGHGPEPTGPMKLWPEVKKRGGRYVGNSRDRNLRRLYLIER